MINTLGKRGVLSALCSTEHLQGVTEDAGWMRLKPREGQGKGGCKVPLLPTADICIETRGSLLLKGLSSKQQHAGLLWLERSLLACNKQQQMVHCFKGFSETKEQDQITFPQRGYLQKAFALIKDSSLFSPQHFISNIGF